MNNEQYFKMLTSALDDVKKMAVSEIEQEYEKRLRKDIDELSEAKKKILKK
ncbi:hypothetical protein HS7_08530 [Sulfolobales archaeon HS-7]|nr:hypothetical protein HS7_08530 [Sulfolobales archaeon HS-7]